MKQVHWQLPFASLNGTQYRIDIYAEGAPVGGIRQLIGGATPFTTDEDNSDDFFAPVRSQTGCINIIDEDGTLMDSGIMPSDNVDKPVRLIRVSDGAVMWQGFLSCETYSQAYTSRPNEVTLNVNSVMEAMASVQITGDDSGFFTIAEMMSRVFKSINEKANIGTPIVSRFSVPQNDVAIMDKFIDTTVMFDLKQQDNEDSTTYTPVGVSMKDVIIRVCKYMGWTARESSTNVYISNGKDNALVDYVWNTYYSDFRASGGTSVSTDDMRNFDYRGTGHQIETRQGAKSVEVVASLKDRKLDMSIPDCPVGDLQEKYVDIGNVYATPMDNFDNRVELQGIRARAKHYYMGDSAPDNTIYFRFAEMLPLADAFFHPQTTINWGQGNLNNEFDQFYYAYFCRPIGRDFKSALAIQGVQGWRVKEDPRFAQWYYIHEFFEPTADRYLFKLKSLVRFISTTGWLHLDLTEENVKLIPDDMRQGIQYVTMSVCYAEKWWNGTGWQDDFATFKVNLNNDGSPVTNKTDSMKVKKDGGIFMEIDSYMEGTVELAIYHDVSLIAYDEFYQEYEDRNQAFFSSLKLEYLGVDDERISDRSENHYFQLLGLNFKDEVSVTTDIASDLNNKPSPSILMNDRDEKMTTLYYADGTTERPEKVLLARLAEYYSQVRRKISLEVDRPTTPLPLVRVTGYDKKTYLPLSESRDWRADTSTITFFETERVVNNLLPPNDTPIRDTDMA